MTDIETILSIGELAQATLKLARLERGENPTPKTEELGDINLYISVVEANRGIHIRCLSVDKKARWAQRIRKAPKEAPKEKKTRKSEFLKIFPNAVKMDGIPDFCPRLMDLKYMPSGGCENIACRVCRKCYWEAEVE
nr:MAG TPA: triphosphate pyrophosphohydrolase [Bacteriophage sp.]